MGLEELAKVDLDGENRYKFVVLEVSDGSQTTGVLVGRASCDLHRDIVRDYQRKNPTLDLKVRGGGRINVTREELHAYGYSCDFGKADQATVEQLLTDYAQNTGQKVKVEMGVGY